MCDHKRTQIYRVIIRDGRTQLTERCLDCGQNPNPRQAWVPKSKVRTPIDLLPLLEDMRTTSQHPLEEEAQQDLRGWRY